MTNSYQHNQIKNNSGLECNSLSFQQRVEDNYRLKNNKLIKILQWSIIFEKLLKGETRPPYRTRIEKNNTELIPSH